MSRKMTEADWWAIARVFRAVHQRQAAAEVAADAGGFTCPRCGRTSHHPDDVREGYCGACHDWTGAQP
jgi:hypothetical protein